MCRQKTRSAPLLMLLDRLDGPNVLVLIKRLDGPNVLMLFERLHGPNVLMLIERLDGPNVDMLIKRLYGPNVEINRSSRRSSSSNSISISSDSISSGSSQPVSNKLKQTTSRKKKIKQNIFQTLLKETFPLRLTSRWTPSRPLSLKIRLARIQTAPEIRLARVPGGRGIS